MPILRYWDGRAWKDVGGWTPGAGYVPLTGGTMTGNLIVDSGDKWERQIITPGSIASRTITTTTEGLFDGNIRYTKKRETNFGGTRLRKTGAPKSSTSVATKKYIDELFINKPAATRAALGSNWLEYGEGHGAPKYRMSNCGNFVTLEGTLKSINAVTPSDASQTLFTLPTTHRPGGDVSFMVIGGNNALYICGASSTSGEVRLLAGPRLEIGQYLSIDGCRYPVG